jgi:pyruvate dehydrogenase E2 component (dihydrolipoamide acetyltransferase)
MMELGADEAGSGSETIVFLHGFGGVAGVWSRLAGHFAASHKVLCYDLPGHGRSRDWPEAGPARTAVKAVLADLGRRGLERVHVVGHSMGGAIAALMGLADPQRVASLTLLSPGGFGPEINERLLRRFAAAREPAELLPAIEAMFGWTSPVGDEVLDLYVSSRADPAATARLSEVSLHLSKDGRQGEIPRERLAQLGMPVSVVWGDLDNVLPFRQSRGLPAGFALHALAGKGHMLIEEAEDAIIPVIARTIR